jgi:AbrB family looped-hinge helix DNA binding protein
LTSHRERGSITRSGNTSEAAMKITTKGQVTIPVEVRERLGLLPNTEVEFVLRDGHAELRKLERSKRRGAKVVAHLRGRGTVPLTTEQIMALTRGE